MTPQNVTRAASWRHELDLAGTLVLADPARTLYRALGARRPAPLWVLRRRVTVAGVRALLTGERLAWARGDDPLLLGVDAVTDRGGRIAFLHRAADPADRTPPDDLIAVARGL